MTVVQVLVGLVVGGFLVTLVVGLATGRIAWRQEGCCTGDPARDSRMAAVFLDDDRDS
jgi:hypothetical protein